MKLFVKTCSRGKWLMDVNDNPVGLLVGLIIHLNCSIPPPPQHRKRNSIVTFAVSGVGAEGQV
jgi:hypothetical protein